MNKKNNNSFKFSLLTSSSCVNPQRLSSSVRSATYNQAATCYHYGFAQSFGQLRLHFNTANLTFDFFDAYLPSHNNHNSGAVAGLRSQSTNLNLNTKQSKNNQKKASNNCTINDNIILTTDEINNKSQQQRRKKETLIVSNNNNNIRSTTAKTNFPAKNSLQIRWSDIVRIKRKSDDRIRFDFAKSINDDQDDDRDDQICKNSAKNSFNNKSKPRKQSQSPQQICDNDRDSAIRRKHRNRFVVHFARGSAEEVIAQMLLTGCVRKRRYGIFRLRTCYIPKFLAIECADSTSATSRR